jgi:hypothetical protein
MSGGMPSAWLMSGGMPSWRSKDGWLFLDISCAPESGGIFPFFLFWKILNLKRFNY